MAPPLRRCPHVSREFITIRRLHRCVEGVYKSPSMSLTVSLLYGSPGHFSRRVQVHFHNYCSCGTHGGKMWRQHEREALTKLLISSERSDLRKTELMNIFHHIKDLLEGLRSPSRSSAHQFAKRPHNVHFMKCDKIIK